VMLVGLLRGYQRPLPAGTVLVACRPVLSTPDDERVLRDVLTTAFNPSRIRLIDTVRAAAVGAGAAPGALLVADLGAQITEVALLSDGRGVVSRRRDLGVDDFDRRSYGDAIVAILAQLVGQLRREPQWRHLSGAALRRGILLVGGGATQPRLTARAAAALNIAVRPAPKPRIAAAHGAGLAAFAALRRTASIAGLPRTAATAA
jgi:rod shape-determining protein MreB and related proteins